MIWEQITGEIMAVFSAVVASLLTWLTTRKRQNVDTKKIEVEVWEKTLDVIQMKVVKPLSDRIDILQNENEKVVNRLNILQNAINKMYYCRYLVNCPIRSELRNKENSRDTPQDKRGNTTNRQREPTDNNKNDPVNYPGSIGENETEPP